jgi:hypothetical protein
VALHRYRRVTGDERFGGQVASARDATRAMLALRPMELLYRIVYAGVRLTLVPAADAGQLPLPKRALKRLLRIYLLPNLFRLKRAFPRLVMPGGFVDRHLSHLHFDGNYHAVNVMDLARLWRQFPDERLEAVLDDAIRWVVGNNQRVLRWWAEAPPRQFAVVVFAEALYHLCMLRTSSDDRRHLAETIMQIEDLGLGLPPSLLGGNAEITPRARQVPCPSPTDRRLRIVNLSTSARDELMVVNPTQEDRPLQWETPCRPGIVWKRADGATTASASLPLKVPARSWLTGVHATSAPDSAVPQGKSGAALGHPEVPQVAYK